MLDNNQFKLKPGVYEHYKGGIYVVENIVTHEANEDGGDWIHLQDPKVIYRNLDAQYATINDVRQQIIKTFSKRLSEFTGWVEIDGEKVQRYKPI